MLRVVAWILFFFYNVVFIYHYLPLSPLLEVAASTHREQDSLYCTHSASPTCGIFKMRVAMQISQVPPSPPRSLFIEAATFAMYFSWFRNCSACSPAFTSVLNASYLIFGLADIATSSALRLGGSWSNLKLGGIFIQNSYFRGICQKFCVGLYQRFRSRGEGQIFHFQDPQSGRESESTVLSFHPSVEAPTRIRHEALYSQNGAPYSINITYIRNSIFFFRC